MPEFLDKQQPGEAEQFSPATCLGFEYRYPILPEGLLPRFVVRSHVMSEGQPRWRSGVILQFEDCRAWSRPMCRTSGCKYSSTGLSEPPAIARRDSVGLRPHSCLDSGIEAKRNRPSPRVAGVPDRIPKAHNPGAGRPGELRGGDRRQGRQDPCFGVAVRRGSSSSVPALGGASDSSIRPLKVFCIYSNTDERLRTNWRRDSRSSKNVG